MMAAATLVIFVSLCFPVIARGANSRIWQGELTNVPVASCGSRVSNDKGWSIAFASPARRQGLTSTRPSSLLQQNHQFKRTGLFVPLSASSSSPEENEEDLRYWDTLQNSPAEQSRLRRRTVFSHKGWLKHRASDRFFRNLGTIPSSYIVQNLLDEVAVIVVVCIFVILYNELLFDGYVDLAEVHHNPPLESWGKVLPMIKLPTLPFTLSSSALSLLLVFRTNTSYARWLQGRSFWRTIVTQSRSILLMATVFSEGKDAPHPTDNTYRTGDRDEAIQRLAIATWSLPRMLRKHLSGPYWDPDTEFENDVTAQLADYPDMAQSLLNARHRPLRALYELHRAANDLPFVTHDQRNKLVDKINTVVDASGNCESLYATPVPLSYTRHTARFLTIWLLLLPLALYDAFGGDGSWNHFSMIPASAVLSFLFFGIEEIAVSLEEPFSIMPLDRLSDDSRLVALDLKEWMDEVNDSKQHDSITADEEGQS